MGGDKVDVALGNHGPLSGEEVDVIVHQRGVFGLEQFRVNGRKEGVELDVSAGGAELPGEGGVHGVGPAGRAGHGDAVAGTDKGGGGFRGGFLGAVEGAPVVRLHGSPPQKSHCRTAGTGRKRLLRFTIPD